MRVYFIAKSLAFLASALIVVGVIHACKETKATPQPTKCVYKIFYMQQVQTCKEEAWQGHGTYNLKGCSPINTDILSATNYHKECE